jgi:hypothetical protein
MAEDFKRREKIRRQLLEDALSAMKPESSACRAAGLTTPRADPLEVGHFWRPVMYSGWFRFNKG